MIILSERNNLQISVKINDLKSSLQKHTVNVRKVFSALRLFPDFSIK